MDPINLEEEISYILGLPSLYSREDGGEGRDVGVISATIFLQLIIICSHGG